MSFIESATFISTILIGMAIFLVFIRIALGPSIEDRVVGIDLFTSNAIAFIAVYSIQSGSTTFLDVGIILALISFLGTIAFAFYLQRRIKR
jgi:multicomponent Na+:H+ antiporter subunit F